MAMIFEVAGKIQSIEWRLRFATGNKAGILISGRNHRDGKNAAR
jgi:hypothetical protein